MYSCTKKKNIIIEPTTLYRIPIIVKTFEIKYFKYIIIIIIIVMRVLCFRNSPVYAM